MNLFRFVEVFKGLSQLKLTVFLIFLVVISRIATLNLPQVNLEFAFVDAVNYFISGENYFIETYFQCQANTLGTSYLVYLLLYIMPSFDILVVGRLLSVMGLVITGYSIYLLSIRLKLEKNAALLLLVLVLFNPLIWIYGGRFTADIFPMSIGLLGFTILLISESRLNYYLSSILIGLSAVLKYHSVLFLCVAMLYILYKEKKIALRHLAYAITSLSILFLYILLTYYKFGFFLYPDYFHKVHNLNLSNWFSNMVSYSTYIILILMPLSIISIYRFVLGLPTPDRIKLVFIVVFIGLFGLIFFQGDGEMNFGPLDRFISYDYSGILQVMGAFFIIMMLHIYRGIKGLRDKDIYLMFLLMCVVFVLLFSLTRPAQRYLIYIIPLAYLLLVINNNIKTTRILAYPMIVIFIILNSYSSLYQYSVGNAAKEMAGKIIDAGYIDKTALGDILPHVGDIARRGYRNNVCNKYKVYSGEHNNAILMTRVSSFGIVERSYSLVKNKSYKCD